MKRKWNYILMGKNVFLQVLDLFPQIEVTSCPWTEEPGGLQSMGSLSRTWLSDFTFTFHFHALEKEMATHSSVLAWRIPGTEEPIGLPSMGSHRVGHDWSDLAAAAVQDICMAGISLPGIPLAGTLRNSCLLSSCRWQTEGRISFH